MTERERRIAENEALFRDLNEEVGVVAHSFSSGGEERTFDFLCECGDAGCATAVPLTLAEYEEIRRSPVRFFACMYTSYSCFSRASLIPPPPFAPFAPLDALAAAARACAAAAGTGAGDGLRAPSPTGFCGGCDVNKSPSSNDPTLRVLIVTGP